MNQQKQRDEMVQSQLMARGIKDEKVLEAFRRVPRHKFVSDGFSESAYQDSPLPIGGGQTISQPYMVALMTELAKVNPGDKVLEVGTGSLYQAAILAYMGAQVYSMERKKELAQRAAELLKKIKINDIRIQVGDGSRGWPENAPYDSIIVTAAAPQPPDPLIEQ
ncbi:MAG: protein-L-isoaspartate(D-aspartate) O-methyltransferase, partial [Elusimicrobiota bacterium]